MSILPIRPTASSADDTLPQTLIDRVIARVNDAGESVDRRASATRPRASRRRSTLDPLSADMTRTPEQLREARSLRRVFTEFGDAHRQYRLRTGQHTSPALREAAQTFKKAPSLTSLVAVAAFLDEDGLLEW